MKKNNYPGKFVVIDGLDGAGKSTQMAFMENRFLSAGFHVFSGHEPTETSEAGKLIQDTLFGRAKMPEDPLDFQKLYVQDRKEHLEKEVIPALKKENSVYISDRYFFATLAFGMAGGASFEDLMKLHEDIIGDDFILPDVNIVLNTNPKNAMMRLEKYKGANQDAFEKKKGFQEKVSEKMQELVKRFEDSYIVNGDQDIGGVSNEIEKILKEKFF